jgi:hypothetical protein
MKIGAAPVSAKPIVNMDTNRPRLLSALSPKIQIIRIPKPVIMVKRLPGLASARV